MSHCKRVLDLGALPDSRPSAATAAVAVTGAEISQYLLEKSRLVNQEEGEQNFHVLYYMFASPDKDKYRLTSPDEFPYMSHPADLDKKYIAKEYQAVLKALEDVGFTPELIHELHSVLAAVLHLGNVML